MSGRIPLYIIPLVLLTLLCALPAAGAGDGLRAELDSLLAGGRVKLAEEALLPEEYTGFSLLACADAAANIADRPVGIGDDGQCRYAIDEDTARFLFKNAQPLSIGPDGAVLWQCFVTGWPDMADDPWKTRLFIQRGKTLRLLLPSGTRGADDVGGSLGDTLRSRLNVFNDAVQGTVNWSPDGRYLFFDSPDLWYNRLQREDPFLFDTQTGEIFLIETNPNRKILDPKNQAVICCILAGGFSADGTQFCYLSDSCVYGAGLETVELKTYDLRTEQIRTVYTFPLDPDMKNRQWRCCEMGSGRWIVTISTMNDVRVIRLAASGSEVTAVTDTIPRTRAAQYDLVAINQDRALLLSTLMNMGYTETYLLPLDFDGPPVADGWRAIDTGGEEITVVKADFAAADAHIAEALEFYELKAANATIPFVTNRGLFSHAAVLDGTDWLLVELSTVRGVADSWPQNGARISGLFLFNARTLRFTPIGQSNIRWNSREARLYANRFLHGVHICRLASAGTAGSAWYVIPPTEDRLRNALYSTSRGAFKCSIFRDGLLIEPEAGYTESSRAWGTVSLSEAGYEVNISFECLVVPEDPLLVPRALTVERYEALKAALPRKELTKLRSFYTLYDSAALEKLSDRDREKLLDIFPALRTQALYILRDGQSKSQLRTVESALAKAGYTAEDYAADMAGIPVERRPGKMTRAQYAFVCGEDQAGFPPARVLELSGLCDSVCSAVYTRFVRPVWLNDPAGTQPPVAADALLTLVRDTYVIDGTSYRVLSAENLSDGEKLNIRMEIEALE